MSALPEPRRLRCLVVDDEPLARRILEAYIAEHPLLVLAGSCGNGMDALAALQSTPVDVMFLDINMPRLSGLDLLQALPHPPKTIFTTAYSEHAAQAFDLAATDYLLKPIARERFLRAVARLASPPAAADAAASAGAGGSVYVRVDQQLVRLALDEIEVVEACENYVRIHTPRKTYLTKRTMMELAASLPAERFVRVHRSFLVNLARIDRIEGNLITVGAREVPVSRTLRAALLERLPIA